MHRKSVSPHIDLEPLNQSACQRTGREEQMQGLLLNSGSFVEGGELCIFFNFFLLHDAEHLEYRDGGMRQPRDLTA